MDSYGDIGAVQSKGVDYGALQASYTTSGDADTYIQADSDTGELLIFVGGVQIEQHG